MSQRSNIGTVPGLPERRKSVRIKSRQEFEVGGQKEIQQQTDDSEVIELQTINNKSKVNRRKRKSSSDSSNWSTPENKSVNCSDSVKLEEEADIKKDKNGDAKCSDDHDKSSVKKKRINNVMKKKTVVNKTVKMDEDFEPENKRVKKGRCKKDNLVKEDKTAKDNMAEMKQKRNSKARSKGARKNKSEDTAKDEGITGDEIKSRGSVACNAEHQDIGTSTTLGHSDDSTQQKQDQQTEEKHSQNLANFATVNLASEIKGKKPKTPVKQKNKAGKAISSPDPGDDIKKLLLQFEGGGETVAMETSDAEEESDWEEVEDVGGPKDIKSQLPEEAVEITLEGPTFNRKKKKKKFDMQEWFRLQMNRYKRETQLCVHKVHLLCLLGHGFHRNRLCNSPLLQAALLSILPESFQNISHKSLSLASLSHLTQWFSSVHSIDSSLDSGYGDLEMTLVSRLSGHCVRDVAELVYLFITLLRLLGLETRLVMSLQPASHRAKDLKLKPKEYSEDQPSTSKEKKMDTKAQTKTTKSKNKQSSVTSKRKHKQSHGHTSQKMSLGKQTSCHGDTGHVSPYFSEENEKQTGKKKTKPGTSEKCRANTKQKFKKGKGKQSRSRRNSKVESYCELSGGSENEGKKAGQEVKRTGSKQKKSDHGDTGSDVQYKPDTLSSDEDFEADDTQYRSPTAHSQRVKQVRSHQSPTGSKVVKMVSSDSEASGMDEKGTDHWVEVYLQTEKKWICVECSRALVDVTDKMEAMVTQPLQYVIGFNAEGSCKDISRKYAGDWMCGTHRLRVEEEWWAETMEVFKGAESVSDRQEDTLIQTQMMRQPIPGSVSQLKNHPLYALKRHLLKFEAIYPVDAPPMGFVRGEPVYARECVHTLHSRENWLKEARVVRLNEEAYKWVKARPKRRQKIEDKPTLPLFGYWQTEDYIPPPAVNGKVPRNEYGNVELFKPSMLPGGTVHLQVPGLNRVAKKLGLDCVAAMTGWDHHSGYAHPILDGWIVCEEHKDTLLSAWDEQQEIDREKEAQKREKRVFENWRKLVRGLMIRDRLKRKYNLGDTKTTEASASTTKDAKSPNTYTSTEKTAATETAMAWPRNRQQEKEKETKGKKRSKAEQGPLFPFEMKVETM